MSTNDADGIPPQVIEFANEMLTAPRHLGIHSGGMVICDRPIIEVCPVEWARMPGRTVLQWDKDDCAAVDLVKFDLLGLGMLSALHYAFDFIEHASWISAACRWTTPRSTTCCAAPTRSGCSRWRAGRRCRPCRACKPRTFYDLVVEVALIRPGPIQGGSVHPFIRRKNGQEEWQHPASADGQRAGASTLGVPLFQEQMMQLAIDVAGFSPAEADQLRRAMGSKRSMEKMERAQGPALRRAWPNGHHRRRWPTTSSTSSSAFASYGFPESHAMSFAYLVYASAWLKRYYPAAFCAALLNAQPMGFYSPQSLVDDARRHGVEVRRPDINRSATPRPPWSRGDDRRCEPRATARRRTQWGLGGPVVRLGLSSVRTARRGTGRDASRRSAGRTGRTRT